MQVFSQERVRLCLLQDYTQLAIRKKLADGDKELSFRYPNNGEGVKYLKPECYIMTQEDEFILKEVSTSKQYIKYTAILNLEELQGKQFTSFETVERTIAECLDVALLGTGWKVGKCDITKKRTIRKDSVCTALDIIGQCISTYKVEVEYRTKEKLIDIYEKIGVDKGVYFMEAVNLRQPPSYSMTTNEFYTQLKPIGKNGLTINVGGKDYVENYSYSKKRLMKIWKDERYTQAKSLEEDARLKLEEICRPTVTYEADVIDLAKASEEYRDILAYSLGDVVTLVSKSRGIKEKMRIVQIVEYPQQPQNNTCQLSTAKKTFADIQKELKEEAVKEATGASAANTSEAVDQESDITSEEIRLSLEGMKTEILKDVSDAYLAKGQAQDIEDAAARAAAQETKTYVDGQLESYVTEKKLQDEITEIEKDVLQKVSQEYADKEQVAAGMKVMQQSVSELQQSVREQFVSVGEQLTKLEEEKGIITASDGSKWSLVVDTGEGRLYVERLEE